MASANEGFEVDPLHGGSFSRFLGSGDEASVVMEGGTGSFIFPAENTPKMLCFGNPCNQGEKAFGEYGGVITHQRLGINVSDSSSTSSSNYSSTASFSNSKSESEEAKIEQKKRNGSDLGTVPASNLVSGASGGNRKTNKKAKTEYPTWKTGPVKARKEKLGERITALQQLVSPFGKTDTASVLHEAMGYIRFLQDQVQVLSSPYMQQQLPSPGPVHDEGRGKEEEEESKYNLRSRGLCLVPVACTVHVANNNWADLWSPANFYNSKQQ